MAITLITGANRGIGRMLAQFSAARGDTVYGAARNADGAAAIKALQAHGAVTPVTLDVTDPAGAETLSRALGDGGIDLLVCNAGALIGRGGIDDPAYTAEAWAAQLMTNVAGPFFTARAFLPQLERAGGKIAIISSIMGCDSRARGSAYAYRASKAAATNLARNLAVELKARGVAVGAYHPGWARTDMGGDAAEISVEESAAGLLARFDALSPATTGVVEDWRGEPLPD